MLEFFSMSRKTCLPVIHKHPLNLPVVCPTPTLPLQHNPQPFPVGKQCPSLKYSVRSWVLGIGCPDVITFSLSSRIRHFFQVSPFLAGIALPCFKRPAISRKYSAKFNAPSVTPPVPPSFIRFEFIFPLSSVQAYISAHQPRWFSPSA